MLRFATIAVFMLTKRDLDENDLYNVTNLHNLLAMAHVAKILRGISEIDINLLLHNANRIEAFLEPL